jgi:hypothetical protein
MKTTGIIILVTGLLITIFTTFGLMEARMIGNELLSITPHTVRSEIWQPLFGALVVMLGIWVNTVGRRAAAMPRTS